MAVSLDITLGSAVPTGGLRGSCMNGTIRSLTAGILDASDSEAFFKSERVCLALGATVTISGITPIETINNKQIMATKAKRFRIVGTTCKLDSFSAV